MGIWRQLAEYLYIRKRNPDVSRNTNMRLMNGMNRISIFMFLIVIIIMLIRLVLIPLFR